MKRRICINAKDHLGLVYQAAHQTLRKTQGEDFDELVSAGTIGLMQAVKRFDPEMGIAFNTFAIPRIRGAIIDDMRTRHPFPRKRRKLRIVDIEVANTLKVSRPTDTTGALEHESEMSFVTRAILSELNQQQQIVLACYYFEEMKMREIAEVLGLTESRISQIRSAAIHSLKESLNDPSTLPHSRA